MRSIAGSNGAEGFSFWCPGCNGNHGVWVKGATVWTFNGNTERPTFQPSLLVRSGHYLYGSEHIPGKVAGQDPCWCTWNRDHPGDPAPFKCTVCHTFVTDGMIQFLGDCTHELAGQTVEMPLHPSWNEAAGEPPADGSTG
jgi:hypothetical protein